MTNPSILTINGGSSSTKFALYQTGERVKRGLHGKIDRVGMSGTNLTFNDPAANQQESPKLAADHNSAASFLMDWLEEQRDFDSVQAVGHRVVHGMHHTAPSLVTEELLVELRRISPCDPDHLPSEIEVIEAFRQRHSKLPQVVCLVLCPFFGLLLSPMIAGAAISLSSVSVIGNALRLRKVKI